MNKYIVCILSLFVSSTYAKPVLNGLASHKYLGQEVFIAALYVDNPTSNADSLQTSREAKSMELRVTANYYSARRIKQMWIEGVAINNVEAVLRDHAQDMVNFTDLIKKKLVVGDILTINSSPGEGILVSVNDVELGIVESDTFFPVLLRTWIGPVPLSSEFREGLLKAGSNIDGDLLARYRSTTPSPERVAAINAWIAEDSTSDQKISDKGSIDSVPKIAETSAVPDTAMLPPRQPMTESVQAQASTRQNTAAEPESRPVEVAIAGETSLEAILFDQQTLDAEEDSQVLTTESLLSHQLYHAKLVKWVYRYLTYPKRAMGRGNEGSLRLSVIINRKGYIQNLSIVEESPYKVLNMAALEGTKDAEPFPPIPNELRGDEFEFSIPVTFSLH